MNPRSLNLARSAMARGIRRRPRNFPAVPDRWIVHRRSHYQLSSASQMILNEHIMMMQQQQLQHGSLAILAYQQHHHQNQKQQESISWAAHVAAASVMATTLAAIGSAATVIAHSEDGDDSLIFSFLKDLLLSSTTNNNNTTHKEQQHTRGAPTPPHRILLCDTPDTTGAVAAVAAVTTINENDGKQQQQQQRETLYDKYQVNWNAPILGCGAFGSVHVCHDRTTRNMEPCAIKRLPLRLRHRDDDNNNNNNNNNNTIMNEVEAMHRIRQQGGHPHLLALRDVYRDDDNLYVVMDAATGGEVYNDVAKHGAYSPAQAAHVIAQVASAIDFLHTEMDMVHGDVKPENVLLLHHDNTKKLQERRSPQWRQRRWCNSNPAGWDHGEKEVALIDFGCASSVNAPSCTVSCQSGTSAYWPPERFSKTSNGPTTPAMDMWSLGILLYILLEGAHPFDLHGTLSENEVDKAIVACTAPPQLPALQEPFNRNDENVMRLTGAQDLIDQLLQVDPAKRPTAKQVLYHPWILEQQGIRL